MKKVKIFAHRGASAYAPENTLEAFRLAMEQGADGIELDVQLTKDGVPVVIHDERIDRVSQGKGAVRDYTLEELQKIRVPNGMSRYQDAQIPTLRQVLDLVKPSRMEVNIELKTGIYWYPEIEGKVLELVKQAGMEERVIYSSFNHYSIGRILREKPDAETAYLFNDIIVNVHEYARKNQVKGLHPGRHHRRTALLRHIQLVHVFRRPCFHIQYESGRIGHTWGIDTGDGHGTGIVQDMEGETAESDGSGCALYSYRPVHREMGKLFQFRGPWRTYRSAVGHNGQRTDGASNFPL